MRHMMKAAIAAALAGVMLTAVTRAQSRDEHMAGPPLTILVHGGAGAMEKGRYTPEEEAAYKAKLTEALEAGYAVLERGGSALDAVETAIVILEDSPLFNAGKGAVFTRDGRNELDASIMDGATLNAGAVAGVTRVRNPIRLARAVMEKSAHVMFAREGAEKFAEEQGLELVSPAYFRTEARWKAYRDALEKEKKGKEGKPDKGAAADADYKYGTVGAVALDAEGNLAAGTSTGGMSMKRYGRVGDSPIIGAGTFADNRSCAVSSTGHGEYFIRLAIARDVCAQVEYAGKSVAEAARDVIHGRLQGLGGDGGVIVLGKDGGYTMEFNSKGMFRGVKQAGGPAQTAIYDE
ncbi:isoaspartyl peptidase/L-asparaginase family protein [Amphiplicatus metriothermophilus]|uniref:Isoaspartyl peptidase n=1 Tax=Amphiplicatus metriothermophilus TaxID=1519374 RepID=A0A239PZ48_9PROT|nr:isoaspartyl peptidase/L-asparaginase [Amphiplicatus metriothermophilus]MBB5519735.1 beta-aspartyl-peptidase (threonine type) [Amphiplicatus metriothermophilus]SNT75293.1 beta-aspartyl-peptidase (threonine type) [Amphiplicatus metriothermophilus]